MDDRMSREANAAGRSDFPCTRYIVTRVEEGESRGSTVELKRKNKCLCRVLCTGCVLIVDKSEQSLTVIAGSVAELQKRKRKRKQKKRKEKKRKNSSILRFSRCLITTHVPG